MMYLRLFWEFFKTGLFSIGGGLATLPFLYDMGARTGWFTARDVADMLAVSESTPGPIGVNMATYAGFRCAGLPGSLCATLGLVTPGILVILLIARLLTRFRDEPHVKAAFYGLRPASVGLIAAAGLSAAVSVLLHVDGWTSAAGLAALADWKCLALAALLAVATNRWKKLHPAVFLLTSAAVGIVFRFAGA